MAPDLPYEGAQADIADLIDELEQLAGASRRVPFSHRIVIEEARFLEILDLLRETVPAEIRQAQRVVRDRERILGEAQEEAARILTTARQRGEYLSSSQGVLNQARQRSEDVLRRAEEERQRAVGEVEMFAYERIDRVQQAIRDSFVMIEDVMRDAVADLDEALEQSRDDDRRRDDDDRSR